MPCLGYRRDGLVAGGAAAQVGQSRRHSRAQAGGRHEVWLEPYGYRWFRVGAADNALDRSAL